MRAKLGLVAGILCLAALLWMRCIDNVQANALLVPAAAGFAMFIFGKVQ
jgi:hypothetical protein